MNFEIIMQGDRNSAKNMRLVANVSSSLCAFFKKKYFGNDIQNFDIWLICVQPVPGFEKFHAKRRKSYQETKTVRYANGKTGTRHKVFRYDAKFDPDQYKWFVKAYDQKSLRILAEVLIDSLSELDRMPKKVKDFDVVAFKAAMTGHLQGLVDRGPDSLLTSPRFQNE